MRIQSLDIARGITVAMMIIVNNPGSWDSIYAPLEHAKWHGCTPTDLVFPFFLFWVGVSISLGKNDGLGVFPHKKTFIRTGKLFGLGLLLSLFPKFDFDTVRIMGVLQRIGLVYLAVSYIAFYAKKEYLWWLAFGFILLHYFLLTLVPVPGIGPANLEAETNLGAYLDRFILTEPHLWKAVKTWDPEGLLGTLSSIASGLFGLCIGHILLNKNLPNSYKLKATALLGLALIVLGYCWNLLDYPINKSLWTGSFALFTSGLAALFLLIIYILVDIKNKTIPFQNFFLGMGINAIFVFFVSGLVPRILGMIKIEKTPGQPQGFLSYFYENFVNTIFENPKNSSLLMAFIWLLFYGGICYYFFKKKIVFKV